MQFVLTIVGQDQPEIVAKVTNALYCNGCHLGGASMSRLGSNFTIMLIIEYNGDKNELAQTLKPVTKELGLDAHLHTVNHNLLIENQKANVAISVHGADRTGIVAQVTTALSQAGLNILALESDIGGATDKPFYIMHIEGYAKNIENLKQAINSFKDSIEININPIDIEFM
jgi:glycine cleavage system transcriptional repressor